MATCGEYLVRLLEAYGVELIFGIPGVHTVELYRGLPATRIRHITPRHEQGAGFMADGYARVTGKPGVCFIITGPGSPSVLSNMVPSIEQHANWIAACVAWMERRGLRRIEATRAAEDAWVAHGSATMNKSPSRSGQAIEVWEIRLVRIWRRGTHSAFLVSLCRRVRLVCRVAPLATPRCGRYVSFRAVACHRIPAP